MKHTALPWEYKPNYDNIRNADLVGEGISGTIRSENGWNIARIWEIGSGESKPNAEFIVRACNNHYELLEALKGLIFSSQGLI